MTRRLVAPTLAFLFSLGCTGPQGPEGPAGPTGAAGAACEVTDHGNGSKTIACPGSAPVTLSNGAAGAAGPNGTSCTVSDAGVGTKAISCTDGSSVTVSDGAACAVASSGAGQHTITCPGSAPVVVRDGTSCQVVHAPGGSSILSCNDGTRALLAPPLDPQLEDWEPVPGLVVSVLGVGGPGTADGGSLHAGERLSLTFSVKTGAGRAFDLASLDLLGAWIAGPSTNYQRVLPGARDAVMVTDLATRATLNDDGTYGYTFAEALPAGFGVPLYDTPRFSDGELSGPLTPGTYTVALAARKDYQQRGVVVPDGNSATRDFGLDTAILAPRQLVSTANCETCHGRLRVHDGTFRGTPVCVTCHTAGAEDVDSAVTGDPTPVTIEFRVLLHKLHEGVHLPSVQGLTTDPGGARAYDAGVPYRVGDHDFSAVQFPRFPNFNIAMPRDTGYSTLPSSLRAREDQVRRGVTACATCHGDPDGAGPLAAPAQGATIFTALTRRACGSCHDDVDYARPYTANGSTMPANSTEASCGLCHAAPALAASHRHPLEDPALNPEITLSVTGLLGGTGPGGAFLAGDALSVAFAAKDPGGADVPLHAFDSFTVDFVGPTQNRQVVIPGLPGTLFDTSGRLLSLSVLNKGSMSRVQGSGALVSETLLVDFTSSVAFTVTGSLSGALGSGALPAATSTLPSGASLTNFVFTSAAVAQSLTLSFTSATTYTVTGSVSGPMGSGTLPATASTTQRFTSSDGSVAFNVVIGSSAPASGNSGYVAVVKGSSANPVIFALSPGRTAFSSTDRFAYDFVAPAATYTLALPMDLALEYLGRASGSAGQAFTAANLPVRLGRQSLFERTATPGVVMTTSAPAALMGRTLLVDALDPGLAGNDVVVIDDGTSAEEYVRVASVDAANKRVVLSSTSASSSPLRFAHGVGATVREVTLTYRPEGPGNFYVLAPATGTLTLTGAATAGNAFVLSYRSDARLGWKRAVGDTAAPFYFANLLDTPVLDETWGDWRGKPLVPGTYSFAMWGYRNVEVRSGSSGAYEWQTYRNTTKAATRDVLYGATATTLTPYAKVDDAPARCGACHGELLFHGGGRRGADTCLMCHATNGPNVSMRTLAHEVHATMLPTMPNGSASCVTCHGSTNVFEPSSRSHPTAQGRPSRDWALACTSCHTSAASAAHADTTTSATTGLEACAVCHGPGRDQAVEQRHRAR